MQDSNPECGLEIEFASSNAFGHFTVRIRNGIGECRSEFANTVFFDEKTEILITRQPSDGIDERRVDILPALKGKDSRPLLGY
ncbi:hypothetical protein C451_12235 [Halococcus thailandensis JCM 13552]|uniref:Uncharacterized protein n=1 Tax=Halococcus thailandensis JCM 13552 TaxID=1227457 RepID=M0N6J0_9EURY|nr:hypothetical protein C451_12235 [Halococcus thailandensis JCM 13552]